MTSRLCRRAVLCVLVTTATGPLDAQAPSQFAAAAGAGGSALGWQPQVAMRGVLASPSLGPFQTSVHGSLTRFAMPIASPYELTGGARLLIAQAQSGWWLGGDVVQRNGFKDLIERPRVQSGGWRRFGDVTVGISGSRRSASFSGMTHFARSITTFEPRLDSLTGRWDSVQTTRSVGDSAHIAATRRWQETEATVAWERDRLAAELAVGGRFASRDVPSGAWTAASIVVRLASPLSIVAGAGTGAGGRFVLDREHRYVTLGLRVAGRMASAPVAPRRPAPDGIRSFDVDDLGGGRYRLSLAAPTARRVEISGDFTSWKPVPLSRDDDGRWCLTVSLTSGTHRMNARVDGAGWIVPPGLTTMSDDFAGEVGVLVIEQPRRTEPK